MDVVDSLEQVTLISNHPIEEALLPDRPAIAGQKIDLSRGIPLEALHKRRDGMAWPRVEDGVHMIGHNVTECIASAAALLHQKVKVQDVAETVFAHPTISEAFKEAAEDSLSMALHLPPRKIQRLAAEV